MARNAIAVVSLPAKLGFDQLPYIHMLLKNDLHRYVRFLLDISSVETKLSAFAVPDLKQFRKHVSSRCFSGAHLTFAVVDTVFGGFDDQTKTSGSLSGSGQNRCSDWKEESTVRRQQTRCYQRRQQCVQRFNVGAVVLIS